ncbi:protein of unknown function [Xenorhabdus poinarii G6]|uniref:Uncharacterized protein n=1 Tax=Xenorhabdus poinarii G6 TaxID=1354304 RepID=A0A068R5W6_9GAMM|nr:hypothetical protein [Xenorhabdus poinarii]CDG22404.1 protein of unknown function [Xenorhabdus poinarii G6]
MSIKKEEGIYGGWDKLEENTNEDKPIEKNWIFQEPLPKEKSPYRISLG